MTAIIIILIIITEIITIIIIITCKHGIKIYDRPTIILEALNINITPACSDTNN